MAKSRLVDKEVSFRLQTICNMVGKHYRLQKPLYYNKNVPVGTVFLCEFGQVDGRGFIYARMVCFDRRQVDPDMNYLCVKEWISDIFDVVSFIEHFSGAEAS